MQKHHSRSEDSAITTPATATPGRSRLPLRLGLAGGWLLIGLLNMAPSPVEAPRSVVAADLYSDPDSADPEAVPAGAPVAEAVAVKDPVDSVAAALTDCPNRLPNAQRMRIAETINEESAEHGYDPLFITALIQIESGCRTGVNGRGAIGLTQLLPSTAREVAKRAGVRWNGSATLRDPHENVRIGVQYLSELQGMLDCPFRAMAAYNMGPRPVLHMSSARAKRVGYVRKIMRRYEQLRADHP